MNTFFKPHRIILSIPIDLEGNTTKVDVEVVDTPLEYNLLLGWSWTQVMMAVVLSIFCVINFPHEENIVAIDQLTLIINKLK